jgi:hypothetical protein
MRRAGRRAPGVDTALLVEDAGKLLPEPSRRLFLRNAASLGALTLLTGCDVVDGRTAEKALRVVSQFNDWVRARLFNPNRLAPSYPESTITRPFPFNGYYPEEAAPGIDEDRYKLIVDGLVASKQPWTSTQLYALPQEAQIRSSSASRAGAPSANGRVLRSRIFSPASARISPPSTCRFAAPRATRCRSTCPPPCTRRRR